MRQLTQLPVFKFWKVDHQNAEKAMRGLAKEKEPAKENKKC
jgi:hypothetical protein